MSCFVVAGDRNNDRTPVPDFSNLGSHLRRVFPAVTPAVTSPNDGRDEMSPIGPTTMLEDTPLSGSRPLNPRWPRQRKRKRSWSQQPRETAPKPKCMTVTVMFLSPPGESDTYAVNMESIRGQGIVEISSTDTAIEVKRRILDLAKHVPDLKNSEVRYVYLLITQTAKALGSTSIRHRSGVKSTDRYYEAFVYLDVLYLLTFVVMGPFNNIHYCLKWYKGYSRFLNQFFPTPHLYHELNMIIYTSYINI